MKPIHKVLYIISLVLLLAALILEFLPNSSVLIFTDGSDVAAYTFSYFHPVHLSYGKFAPFFAGILTVIPLVLGVASLFWKKLTGTARVGLYILTAAAACLSFSPYLKLSVFMNACSYAISALLLVSFILQAAADQDPDWKPRKKNR